MAARNNNHKHGQEHGNSRKISELVTEEFSKGGQHFGTLNSCFDFNEFTDDDYIDIEVESAIFWTKLNEKRAESREFEFDAKALMDGSDCVASPADELFYKGQLLPLHLPPRIQMVENLLASEKCKESKPQNLLGRKNPDYKSVGVGSCYREDDSALFLTPYESCDGTPYDSCEASQELNPEVYEAITKRVPIEDAESKRENQKHPMLKKAKKLLDSTQSKQAALALKLKASRSYLKSLFSKTKDQQQHQRRTKESDQRDPMNKIGADQNMVAKAINRYVKAINPGSPNGNIDITKEGYRVAEAVAKSIHKESSFMIEDHVGRRKSFSGSLSSKVNTESHKPNAISSPNGAFLKRSSSTNINIDFESAIEGAIAHCKQSAHSTPKNNENPSHIHHQRPSSNVEGYVVKPRSGSRIAVCEQPEKPGLCRG